MRNTGSVPNYDVPRQTEHSANYRRLGQRAWADRLGTTGRGAVRGLEETNKTHLDPRYRLDWTAMGIDKDDVFDGLTGGNWGVIMRQVPR